MKRAPIARIRPSTVLLGSPSCSPVSSYDIPACTQSRMSTPCSSGQATLAPRGSDDRKRAFVVVRLAAEPT